MTFPSLRILTVLVLRSQNCSDLALTRGADEHPVANNIATVNNSTFIIVSLALKLLWQFRQWFYRQLVLEDELVYFDRI